MFITVPLTPHTASIILLNEYTAKKLNLDWQDVSADKGTCHQAWQSEFYQKNYQDEKRTNPYKLSSDRNMWTVANVCTQTHKQM